VKRLGKRPRDIVAIADQDVVLGDGIVIPVMSASWKASVPIRPRPTCPVIATTGMESIWASASAVTRFVAPGPEVAIITPTRPVACA